MPDRKSSLAVRLAWFAMLWLLGVAALGAVGLLIRAALN
jgi:hypothetical protein